MSRRSMPFDRLWATTLPKMSEEDEQILRNGDKPDLRYSRNDGFPRSSAEHDNLSDSSRERNGEPPNWTDMIINPGFKEAYLHRPWPRISLHLQSSHRQSDPFVSVSGDKLDVKQERKYGRFLLCFLWWSFVVIAIIATLLAVFLLRTDNDKPKAYKEYVKVDMNITVNEEYLPAYDTPTSSQYKSFTEEFCTEVRKAYQSNNSTQPGYYGCQITDLSPGSIIVIFTVYYTDTTIVIVNANARTVIVDYIESNSNKLGRLVIVVDTIDVQSATVITPVDSPIVQEPSPQTTSPVTDLTTTESTVLGTSDDLSDTKPTTLGTDIMTTNAVPTTKMTVVTTNIADKTTTDSSSTTFVSELTSIVTETNLQGTESTTFVNQPSTPSEHSTIAIDTTVIDLSTVDTEPMTSTSDKTPNTSPSIANEPLTTETTQSSKLSEPSTLTTGSSTSGTEQTTAETERTTTLSLSTTSSDATKTVTEDSETMKESTLTTMPEQPTTVTEPTTTKSETALSTSRPTTTMTVRTTTATFVTKTEPTTTNSELQSTASDFKTSVIEQTTIISGNTEVTTTTSKIASASTEETTTVPNPTILTGQKTMVTVLTTTVPAPTVPTEQTTMVTEPTTTIPDPTVPTEQVTKDTEPTTVPDPTVPTEQTTIVTEPTTTVPDPTVPTEQKTMVTDPTTTVPDSTVPTEQTTTVTEPTTTIPDPTVPTEQVTTDTEPTTVPDPTVPTEQTIIVTEPTTTVPDPTVPTEQKTMVTDSTTTVPDPTVPTEQTTTVTEPTTTVPDPTVPTEQTTTVTEPTTTVPDPTVQTEQTGSSTTDTELTTTVTELTTSVTNSITLTTDLTTSSRADSTISTAETTTESNDTISLWCPSSKTLQLYESSVEIACSVSNPQAYNIFHVYHEGGITNSSTAFDVKYYKNGTIFESYQANIGISVVSTDTQLMIRFENVSCSIDGTFSVVLLQDTETVAKSELIITVEGMPQKPFITLNADQVVDLIFPDGNFYRAGRTHKCQGNTGLPAVNLEIDITHDNGTTFKPIPTNHFKLVSRTNVSSNCVTIETLEFALLFTEDMHKARLRCKTAGENPVETLSEELLLIPRNICNCGENRVKRGHPFDCHAYVECIKDTTGVYPLGIACSESECRDSVTGLCSTNCSSAVCDEAVPPDFCPLPTIPTTTEPPSPYVSCQGETIEVTAGPAEITCTLNGTAFSLLNITSRSSTDDVKTVIIQIDNAGRAMDMIPSDDVIASLNGDLVSISIASPSCTTGDFYGVDVIVDDSVVGSSSGKLIVGNIPKEVPILYLHPDQIQDLVPHRDWLLHSCNSDIGFPSGDLVVEILKETDTDFTRLAIDIENNNESLVDSCTYRKEIHFGISFTSDMKNAVIRCGVTNKNFVNYTTSYSNNGSVSLIPKETCENNTGGTNYFPHPSDCRSFVQCEKTTTYGLPCGKGLCFGIEETNACNFCNQVTCPSDVTTTLMTTPVITTETVSRDVSCSETLIEVDTGPAQIVCILNSNIFSLINITYRASTDRVSKAILQIDNSGHVTDLIPTDGITALLESDTIHISIESPTCTTSDFYGVDFIVNGSVVSSSEGKLVVGNRPKESLSLYLHPDQIPDLVPFRNWLLHSCSGDVGFPAGELFVEILRETDIDFTRLTIGIQNSNTSLVTSCSNRKEIKFGIDFTSDMNNAVIRCAVDYEHFENYTTPYSNNASVSLIPTTLCENNPVGALYLPHPADCFSYVLCSGTTTYGQRCASGLCFGIESVSSCGRCHEVTCPSDVTTSMATTPATTKETEISGIECEDNSALMFSENVELVCAINQTVFENIGITFVASEDSSSSQVAEISSSKIITTPADQENIEIRFVNTILTITVKNVTCENDGRFNVNINMTDFALIESARLTVLAKPSGSAALTLDPHQLFDASNIRLDRKHSCQADVGNPPGQIMIEMLLQGENSYRNITNIKEVGVSNHPLGCSLQQKFNFVVNFSLEMNNATIRCKVMNSNYPSLSPIYSNTESLALIPGDFCVGRNNSNYHHPTDCNRFVTCSNSEPFGKKCSTSTSCFDPAINTCNHCFSVNTCP